MLLSSAYNVHGIITVLNKGDLSPHIHCGQYASLEWTEAANMKIKY